MTRSIVVVRTRLLALAVASVLLALVMWQLVGPRPGTTNAHAAAGSVHISMKVTGRKTGVFKGDDVASRRTSDLITVIAYQYELVSPRDPVSGLASGKRQHKPVTITHELGGSSPQFLNAAATNEVLTSVVIDFARADASGKETLFYVVTLTDASVSDVRQSTSGDTVLEEVSFTFRKIEQDDKVAKTSFLDDWESTT